MNDDMPAPEKVDFLFRRIHEECPIWAIGVPIVFALIVLALVVIFRPDKKLLVAIIGGLAVGAISFVYLPVALMLVLLAKISTWLIILVPVMGVALFYVGMMYINDSRSVHWLWAIFLGSLRICVYAILATVFLLPGCQHFEKQEYESKVIFLFDVSGSMFELDELPEKGKVARTRQDRIHAFLTEAKGEEGKTFMDRIVAKSPVLAGRFGPALDEGDLITLHARKNPSLTAGEWRKWLNPDKKDIKPPDVDKIKDEAAKKDALLQYTKRLEMVETLRLGTNIGGACLQMHKLENTSMVQAIIVISDGQSNVGGDDARSEFLARVNSQRRTIPVITVGVGQFRQPVSIRIEDINAPEETRPDDAFQIKVPLVSTGIPGEKVKVEVEVSRVEDVNGKPIAKETFKLEPKEVEFKGAGDQQQAVAEMAVDVSILKGIKADEDKNNLLEGKWEIIAKVAKHPKEPFLEDYHVTDPVSVQVQKRALRVLLFAGGANRDYVFLRTILYREMNEKRMEFCIHNQSTVNEDHIDQDLPPERMLQDFPDRIGSGGKPFMSLSDYDVIVAFDPDWTKLNLSQRENLKKWVQEHGGGIIFVAGQVYSFQLARPGGQDLSAIQAIFPVVLKDSRLHGLTPDGGDGHDPTRPYPLVFTEAAKKYEFLKLDETGESPTAGWNGFFFADENHPPVKPATDYKPKRGFFTYYPVERIKPQTEVMAAFGTSNKKSRIGDKLDTFKDQQPFIAGMIAGTGKSLYVGSAETWRLRAYKDGYHERLWFKMSRYVAAGAKPQKKFGRIVMARTAPVGRIELEAEMWDKTQNPIPADVIPTVQVRKLDRKNRGEGDPKDDEKKDKEKKEIKIEKKDNLRFDLKAKPAEGNWKGTFYGNIIITEPGEYEFKLPVPGVDGPPLTSTVIVRKPNPERDNLRTNFGYLYQLASPSDTLLKGLHQDTKKRIESLLVVPEGQAAPGAGEKLSKRLYFPLSNADAIADALVPIPPKTDTIKGQFEDLWDKQITAEWPLWLELTLFLVPVLIGVVLAILLLVLGNWQGAFLGFFISLAIGLLPIIIVEGTGRDISIFWASLLAPLIVGTIGLGILLLLRQWISAIAFMGFCIVLSLFVLFFCYAPLSATIAGSAVIVVGSLALAVVMLVKQEYFGAVSLIVGVMVLAGIAAGLSFVLPSDFLTRFSNSVREESLVLGFSFLLITAVSLVGVEWLTRKLLRLA